MRAQTNCARRVKYGDFIQVHQRGWTADVVFIDTEQTGEPASFTFGDKRAKTVPGYDQGVLDMCAGERRRLKIPPHLAFGVDGAAAMGIGPNTPIVFEVEVLNIARREL